jgi:hypothetical protein
MSTRSPLKASQRGRVRQVPVPVAIVPLRQPGEPARWKGRQGCSGEMLAMASIRRSRSAIGCTECAPTNLADQTGKDDGGVGVKGTTVRL